MSTWGVTAQGFLAKPLSTVESEVDADLRGILGDSAGTEPDGSIPADSYAGQLKALITDAVAAQWDLQQANYSSRDPGQATGQSLDVVGSLTGVLRDAARFSTVTATCVGVPATVLPTARVASVTGTGARFDTTAQFTIAAATAWVALTAYVVGDKRTNNGNVYRCITAGASAASGGPTTTATDIADATVHWRYIGAGTGFVEATFTAEAVGAVGALAHTLVTIATPVGGWNAVDNQLDAAVGVAVESDAALRVRREQALAVSGNTTVDAIRANVLRVNEGSADPAHAPPTEVTVFFNDTDSINSDGLPPHSIEVLVRNGTDADIAQEIWNSVGAGTATFGTTTSTVTDSQGNAQTVRWSRPTAVLLYVTATAYYDAGAWPSGSDALVAQAVISALLTFGEDYPTGRDARTSPLNAAMMRGPAETDSNGFAVVPASAGAVAVTGLLEVTPIYIGTSPAPVASTPIVISRRQYALFDSTRCVINATTETP